MRLTEAGEEARRPSARSGLGDGLRRPSMLAGCSARRSSRRPTRCAPRRATSPTAAAGPRRARPGHGGAVAGRRRLVLVDPWRPPPGARAHRRRDHPVGHRLGAAADLVDRRPPRRAMVTLNTMIATSPTAAPGRCSTPPARTGRRIRACAAMVTVLLACDRRRSAPTARRRLRSCRRSADRDAAVAALQMDGPRPGEHGRPGRGGRSRRARPACSREADGPWSPRSCTPCRPS